MSSGTQLDPIRRYTPEEDERLAVQLRAITAQVYRAELSGRRAELALLQDLHLALFSGVRGHAGRIRQSGFGQEHLSFGPNRSAHRDHVRAMLEDIFERIRTSIASFDANPDDPAYERLGFRLAVWAHAEVIRITRSRTAMAGAADCYSTGSSGESASGPCATNRLGRSTWTASTTTSFATMSSRCSTSGCVSRLTSYSDPVATAFAQR